MHTLFIANRGEIARRIAKTAKRMGIGVAVAYSEADANALFVQEADKAIALPGNSAAETYLNADAVIASALACGANALHPGYGFLSENAHFAQQVQQAGLIWVGPSPQAIAAVGSKAAAKALALELNIPSLPGYYGQDQSLANLVAQAKRLGAPLMIKASAGGGGRGMRLVREMHAENDADLEAQLLSAQREAQAAFGDPQLLLERALLTPRHIEIQIFADSHGTCVHLGERDCSVQRRHQKIIEESPSPALTAAQRAQLGAWAVAFASKANYVGAGTIEFLWDDQLAQAYLMEMNTRLQVEHPVSEARLGIDLVEWQLRIANGQTLPLTQTQIDQRLENSGHAIEVRLCAENTRFIPQTGTLSEVQWPPAHTAFVASHLRVDSGVQTGDSVSPWYDSMLAKIIAYAPTREAARTNLAQALADTRIAGIDTNRELLAHLLANEPFASGQALVPYLSENTEALGKALATTHAKHAPAFAAACAHQASANTQGLAAPFARPWRFLYVSDGETHTLDLLVANTTQRTPQIHCQAAGANRWHAHGYGSDLLLEDVSFEPQAASQELGGPWSINAPFNGKVVRVAVAVGQTVAKGQTLVVIESMKLEHSIQARQAGVVTAVLVQEQQQVTPLQTLLRADPPAAN